MANNVANETKTSPALIAAAWIVVCVPLAWGVYNTGVNAAKLFALTQRNVAPAAPPTASTPAPATAPH